MKLEATQHLEMLAKPSGFLLSPVSCLLPPQGTF